MEGFSSPPFFFIFIAVISLHSFLLLVRAKLVVPGSFGGSCFQGFIKSIQTPLARYRRCFVWTMDATSYPQLHRSVTNWFRPRLHDLCFGESPSICQ
ncbi:hypothetical protein F5890DRAFT_268350 [Lentinula detonsa]|uniref:Uncharacterized protein n=1 Tax=Lentinula detonsa TaxID=2804962 RepID=A0AA38PWH9_9AGAR|nr:hypothetical protein F5890DRAFT_268350 [Lentinula detonsa]